MYYFRKNGAWVKADAVLCLKKDGKWLLIG